MWSGSAPNAPSWKGDNQFPGAEELYLVPEVSNTTTPNQIGILDGNLVNLPTSYPVLNVATLNSATINNSGTATTATLNSGTINNSGSIITNLVNAQIGDITTINSTTINNSGNINTNTINGNAVPTSAEYWANYPAINNIVAKDGPRTPYVPNEWYSGFLGLSNVSFGSPYQNYNTIIPGKGLNPGNRLDPFDANVNYSVFQGSTGSTFNGVQYISLQNNIIPAFAPPNPTYWRLAEYQDSRAYTTGELTFHAATNAWYTSIAGSTGQAPPNATYWNVFQRWTIIASPGSISQNYWNISNFNNISSNILTAPTGNITQVNAYTVNAADGNVTGEWRPDTLISRVDNTQILNVGTSGVTGVGGTVNVGTTGLNPTSTPDVTIGNTSFNRCAVKIYGESNLTSFASLLVKGGVTLDAGQLSTSPTGAGLQNHGIDLFACNIAPTPPETSATLAFRMKPGLFGVGSKIEMISVLPTQPIEITARGGIIQITSELLGTYINANTGLYVAQSAGTYGGGRIFTDHICPGYTSGNVLLINGRNDLTTGVTGVQIDNGTTWNTDTLNATTVNATDVNATGSVTATANVYAANVVATGSVSAINVTATGNVSAGVDVLATGNVSAVDVIASGQVNTTLVQSPGTLNLYSDTTGAAPVNIVANGGFQCFAGSSNYVGSPGFNGNLTYSCGGDISFVSSNGGDIIFDNFALPDGLRPITQDVKFNVGRDIILTAANNITTTSVVDTVISADGDLTLNSVGSSATLEANTEVVIDSATSYISLSAGSLQDVKIQSPLDMSINDIKNVNSVIGNTALTLATQTNGNLNLSPNGTGLIEANKNLDMNNNNIVGGNTITGTSILTLTTLSNGNLNLTPDGTGQIVANNTLNMNNNNITGGNTITGTTTLTLASTGNNNINISPAGTGQVVINKQVNFSSQTLLNMTLTNVDFIYSRPTVPLRLISQQATNPSVEIRGALTMWLNQSTQAPGNSIAGLTTLTGQTTLGLATLSNGDLSLSPNGTGTIIANKTLNMNSNAIINAATLNGRNLFAYGNFYNTATQTLGATNTATRVVMNTSLNNNLITLDTTTNIGRLTFTNAGVYHVVWNAYLLHGAGGTAKSVIWIRLNGTDVAGSGKTENNDAQQNETNMTSSSMVSVTAGQYIEFYWAADSTTVPLTAVAASSPYPATPSFSCSVSIVG